MIEFIKGFFYAFLLVILAANAVWWFYVAADTDTDDEMNEQDYNEQHLKEQTQDEQKARTNTCPKCGGIAEYNAYYGRTTCTRCDWESKKEE